MSKSNGTPDKEEVEPLHPRNNNSLLGQETAETNFRKAMDSGKLPHAWLISGPRGVGKATLAYRVVRHLFMEDSPADAGLFGGFAEPTAQSSSGLDIPVDSSVFKQVASGSFPDLRVLERSPDKDGRIKRDIPVDEVRQLGAFLHMTATNGSWRAAILDPVDELGTQGANALLKSLEEPPEKTLLLLISHNPGRLLPTIRSRCRQLSLPPLEGTIVEQLLERYLPDLHEDERTLLTYLSEGSIGRALDLNHAGGAGLYIQMVEMMGQLPALDSYKLHEIGDTLARDSQGVLFRTMSELMLWWLGRLVRLRATQSAPIGILEGEGEVMQRLSDRRELADWMRLWENLTQLFQQTEQASLDRKQAFITAFGRLQGMAA
ncbi:MAG: DNA polymerase III subunit delta' [Pseudomonadota bacterium]